MIGASICPKSTDLLIYAMKTYLVCTGWNELLVSMEPSGYATSPIPVLSGLYTERIVIIVASIHFQQIDVASQI